jgi:hypothetical protein
MKNTNNLSIQIFILLTIFAIAMGFLEAIVVVYLRQLYYPEGFSFPFVLLPNDQIIIEWVREFTTLVMLVSVGIIAGRNKLQRFFYFLLTFGIWDIFYYVGLKAFLDWPESLLTWDILFLIPLPWIGPVLAPVICSLVMIIFAITTLSLQEKGRQLTVKPTEWALILSGVILILYSFTEDFFRLIIQNDLLTEFFTLSTNDHFWKLISEFKPTNYNWLVFIPGILLILAANVFIVKRLKSS